MPANVLHPASITSSTKASRVPGGRRGTQHLDLHGREVGVDVLPGLVGVGLALASVGIGRHFLGQGKKEITRGEAQRLALLRVGHRDTVVADLQLDDLLDAVLGAPRDLALFDAPRRVGQVGMLHADAGAEELQTAARARGLHLGGLELGGLAELLGHHRGKLINGGRSQDLDVVPLLRCRRGRQTRRGQCNHGRLQHTFPIHTGTSFWLNLCR